MKRFSLAQSGAMLLGLVVAAVDGSDHARSEEPSTAPAAPAMTYTLRYKFVPNEKIRWQVVHRAKVDTTVSGTSQVAETASSSVKVWHIGGVDAKRGWATIAHSVESVDMRQQISGREEVHYNSLTDKTPPIGFEDAAKSVGVVLSVITLDAQGNIVRREDKHSQSSAAAAQQITVVLPSEAIPVGHTWEQPHDMDVTVPGGQVKKIKTRQVFTLTEVTGGIATITIDTQVLTPIHDPAIEAQLIQREISGRLRFDIAAGRIISQQMDLDKRVLGFSGDASSLHYVTRFTEDLLPASPATAARRPAGPEFPAGPARTATRPATPSPDVRTDQSARPKSASPGRQAGKSSSQPR